MVNPSSFTWNTMERLLVWQLYYTIFLVCIGTRLLTDAYEHIYWKQTHILTPKDNASDAFL